MASITLDFLNKNLYRKYPFRGTSTHIFTNGRELPQSLIAAMQISTISAYRKVYVSSIYSNGSYLSVLLREVDTDIVLGSFSAAITASNQVIVLDPVVKEVSGTLTVGNKDALSLVSGTNFLTSADGRLEDSTIFVFTTPGVKSISNDGDTATGFVKLVGDNVKFVESTPNITLQLISTATLLSNSDKSGVLGNCTTPLIKQINTVFPDSNGNIDIYGIEPVEITLQAKGVRFGTPSLQFTDVCPEKLKLSPPMNNSDTYFDDISTTTAPEWKGWSFFS